MLVLDVSESIYSDAVFVLVLALRIQIDEIVDVDVDVRVGGFVGDVGLVDVDVHISV